MKCIETPDRREGSLSLLSGGDVLSRLQEGHIESASFSEIRSIDFRRLIIEAVPEMEEDMDGFHVPGPLPKRMQATGAFLLFHMGLQSFFRFASHRSDTVRGWAAYMVAGVDEWSLADRLQLLQRLADDSHFAVRDWASHAIRPAVARGGPSCLEALEPYAKSDSPYLRRFAVEATRPRGRMGTPIPSLIKDPYPGLSILEPNHAHDSSYVQDAVGAWLADARRDHAEWVADVAAKWEHENPNGATRRVLRAAMGRRALRIA